MFSSSLLCKELEITRGMKISVIIGKISSFEAIVGIENSASPINRVSMEQRT